MISNPAFYPLKSRIRYEARRTLRGSIKNPETVNEELLQEFCDAAFDKRRNPDLHQFSDSRLAAKSIEDRVANDIVNAYRSIQRNAQNSIVQKLNELLD